MSLFGNIREMWSTERTDTDRVFLLIGQSLFFFSFPPHYHRVLFFPVFIAIWKGIKERRGKRNVVSYFSLIYYAGESNRIDADENGDEVSSSRAPERGGRSFGDGGCACRIAGVAGFTAHQSLGRPRRCRQIHLAGTSHVISTFASVAGHPVARPQSKTSSSLVI